MVKIGMAKRYNQVICAICGKHFNPQNEGFVREGKLICADCWRKHYADKEHKRDFERN